MFIVRYFFPPTAKVHVPPPDPTEQVKSTVCRLKLSLDELSKREVTLQSEIKLNKDEARKCVKNNDARNAELYLKKAKFLEATLGNIVSNKFNISSQIYTLENSSLTNQLISDMEQTRQTFRAVSQVRDPDYVNSLIREVTTEMDKETKIQSSLTTPIIPVSDVSDELKALQEDIERERNIEFDMKMLELDAPKHKVVNIQPSAAAVAVSEKEEKRPHPRVIKLVNGAVVDSRY